jgi:hypothetical protein
LERAELLDFGVGLDNLMDILSHGGRSPIHEKGIQSVTKVLHAARDSLGLEFCPLLPEITCLLLSFMPVGQYLDSSSFEFRFFALDFAIFSLLALCYFLH